MTPEATWVMGDAALKDQSAASEGRLRGLNPDVSPVLSSGSIAMPNSYTPVHIHFVWATFDREPLLLPEWENRLHGAIGKKCEELRAQLLAVNSMPNHVHVLVRLPATVSLAQMEMHLKGSTSHLINDQMQPNRDFKWQGAYAAFCVCPEGLDAVCAYIRNQKHYHRENSINLEWERTEE